MEILVLGGTGPMGIPLVEQLSLRGDNVYVTTRSHKKKKFNTERCKNVTYIYGNAKEQSFFEKLMTKKYDAIVDFMVYSTEELRQRLKSLLEHTTQYVFFSSSRCYADSSTPITENSPRLVDTCNDQKYLSTDEYGLAKGREENLLFYSETNNWTIIRPYITYNTYRIQLGVYEKEHWLKRLLDGRTLVFPEDIASKRTTLTYGPDVASAVVNLIGNKKAYGQAFHITTDESHTWEEILVFYCRLIQEKTGKKAKVKMVENSTGLQKVWNPWQIRYDRLYNRTFSHSKIKAVSRGGKRSIEFKSTFCGLEYCLDSFLKNPKWLGMNAKYEAWSDCQTGEFIPLLKIPGVMNKLIYFKYRYLVDLTAQPTLLSKFFDIVTRPTLLRNFVRFLRRCKNNML